MSKTAIEVDNVSMKFNLSREKVDSLKDYIFKTIKREIQYNEFWALKNVSSVSYTHLTLPTKWSV